MRHAVYLSALLFVWGASATVADDGDGHHGKPWAETDGSVEHVYGMIYEPEGLTFQVQSTGCTEQEHFRMVRYQTSPAAVAELLLIRIIPDFCDACVPFGETIFFSYKELGLELGQTFSVLNPRAVNTVRADL